MKNISLRIAPIAFGAGLFLLIGGPAPARAANVVDTWNNLGGDNAYTNAANWSGGVPNLQGAVTALIANGNAVTYTPGNDLAIDSGGVLEIQNGSWTQAGNNNWIQLGAGGTILVDGGTFNQGTTGANPFNVGGASNFTITAGAANFNANFIQNASMAYTQSGGTVTITGHEFDFNGASNVTISGGVFNVNLITGINALVNNYMTLSGGTMNIGVGGLYNGSSAHYVDFSLGSTGVMTFAGTSLATVQGYITGGGIEYGNALSSLSLFQINDLGGGSYSVALVATPEPSTWAMLGFGVLTLAAVARRTRFARE